MRKQGDPPGAVIVEAEQYHHQGVCDRRASVTAGRLVILALHGRHTREDVLEGDLPPVQPSAYGKMFVKRAHLVIWLYPCLHAYF